jgi:copper(I)-binding protein
VNKIKTVLRTFFFLGCLGAGQTALAESPLAISDAWIREAPPATSVLAAYMTIENSGESVQQITGMESPDFRSAEIHRTVVEDGVAKMLPVDDLGVAAGDSVSLEPGGLHVMLFDPQRPLRDGDSATLLVHTASGATITVQAAVRRMTGDDGGHDHSHHHH